MKKIYMLGLFIALFSAMSCSPEGGELAPAPSLEDLTFTATPSAENENIIDFKVVIDGAYEATWDFGNLTSAKGLTATAIYPMKGSYTVAVVVYTNGGSVGTTKEVIIENSDVTLLDREDYNFLTGGGSALEGKNWVFNATSAGHMGIGPVASTGPEWWAAAPNDKDGLGAYDDILNFKLDGFAYHLTNNGDTYIKGYMADYFTGLGATLVSDGGDDFTATVELSQTDWSWTIVDREDGKYLLFNNGAFPSWHTGGNQEYLVTLLDEDNLQLRTIGDDGNAWYYQFVREGYVPEEPEEPEVPAKEYKAEDIYEDFDGNSNITWFQETEDFNMSYDNPVPVGENTSPKVAKYQRTGENVYANVQMQFDYEMDLTERNQITLKVLVPAYNEYTEDGLKPTLSLKLQDADHPSPWETQGEVIHTLTEEQLGKWVELTFDFSGFADRKDFDKIVVQFGGEGHAIPGVFFLDDILLK